MSGGYSFSFGRGLGRAGAADAGADVKTDALVKNAMSVARFIGFVGLVLLVGPALVLFALWPRRLSARDPGRLALTGAGLLAFGAVLEFVPRFRTPPARTPSSTCPRPPPARCSAPRSARRT